ncbi:MAG: carboxypeptidase-like regulatory domain-containing protein [Candidatus Bathyarchaeota archaeon]|nr:carboxypeptidase-like regulatory domain-containing protein [Candidatus Bathyarchaeota archaeon]
MNKKAATFILIVMMSAAILFMPLTMVAGQLGVSIIQVTPSSLSGTVGQTVHVEGTINTSNGTYQLFFGSNLVADKTAEGFYVNATFAVPELPGGSYTLTLRDVKQNVNDTKEFNVQTTYSVKALVPSAPTLLQEGSTVTLNVSVTGGPASTAVNPEITVMLPDPLNTNYSKVIPLTTSAKGTAQTELTFPDPSFQPEGSLTNYAGTYRVYFNQTQQLASDQFFIGFTALNSYHRGQSVAMRAIGYVPNQEATITITSVETSSVVHSAAATASSDGIITSSWTVPSNAVIGDYNITITPQNTPKLVPDSQLITVPGYTVTIKALNLASEPVPEIALEALDEATNKIYDATTGFDGKASVNLESGNHTVTAFWNDVQVGEIKVSVTGENSFTLTCELTNLKITVQNEDGFTLPFVQIDVTYQYVTTKNGQTKTGSASGQTGLSGTYVLNSTLPGISYTVNASLYGIVFNAGNKTIPNLPTQPVSEAVVICPSYAFALKVTGYTRAAIPNARLELVEVTNGLFHGGATDNSGNANVNVTFGKYRVRVYAENVLLNETVIEVFGNTQSEIRCTLYDIQVSVKVVDYFGQPISNVHVIINGPGTEKLSANTQAGGIATFNNIIGGSMQVIAYPAGMENSYEAVNVKVEAPTTIQIKMAKYILLGPFLMEASVLVTILLIAAAIVLFLLIEVYRRRKAKSRKTS